MKSKSSDRDAKLFQLASTMTEQEMRLLAIELERRARLFRSIADGHLKSLSKGLQKAAMSKIEIMFPCMDLRWN